MCSVVFDYVVRDGAKFFAVREARTFDCVADRAKVSRLVARSQS